MRLRPLFLFCLVLAPAGLLGIELFHPAGFTAHPGMYEFLSTPQPYAPEHEALAYPGPQWWFLLHMIQTPLVGLVAVGLWLLVSRVGPGDGALAVPLAWLSRVATFVFLIYYTALDAIGGFGLGRAMINTEALAAAGKLTADQVAGVEAAARHQLGGPLDRRRRIVHQPDRVLGDFHRLACHRPRPIADAQGAVAVTWFSWSPSAGIADRHASPHGPIAFGLLIVAALWIAVGRAPPTARAPATP